MEKSVPIFVLINVHWCLVYIPKINMPVYILYQIGKRIVLCCNNFTLSSKHKTDWCLTVKYVLMQIVVFNKVASQIANWIVACELCLNAQI